MLRSRLLTTLALAGFALIGCGKSTPTSPTPQPVTVLDTTLSLSAIVNCNTGGTSASFTPTNGKTITVVAQGSGAVNPALTLYAPNFAQQLTTALGTGGRATLTFAITQAGSHHISVCDQTGTGGPVRVTITEPG